MGRPSAPLDMYDLMGKRRISITDAARRVEKEFNAEIRVIKKTSNEYHLEKNPLPCPPVAANGSVTTRNDLIKYEASKAAIRSTYKQS